VSSTDPAVAGTSLERILKRDRAVVLSALAIVVGLAWLYLAQLYSPSGMAEMDHAAGMMSSELGQWSATDFLLMLLMWSVMMIGMMAPSAAPMILIYARVARQAVERGTPFAQSAWFAFGYFLVWSMFALAATLLQLGLERALLLSSMMASATPLFSGVLMIVAGIYQMTPRKTACLSQCQSPFQFIQRHGGFRPARRAAIALGLQHGAYCLGCCWALMLLLFVFGVMNLLWIAALGALVLLEKLIPGRLVQRLVGAVLIIGGAALLT
jgi:predicted metal-binding membrane protein